ncbi:hypothetical protein SK128_011580 [Halocaridina rubra]|uniref:Cadherin domain-containing protein n=1 Tax=Halocaridina rubra TaxID=373956 RepID=A0AAN8XGW5_HALRR
MCPVVAGTTSKNSLNGKNGQFLITSDRPEDIEISPDDTRLNASLSLTALWREGTIFDYESTQDPIIIQITATEKEDSSHATSVTLTITLLDENDNAPVFPQTQYTENVEETRPQGFVVMTVSATDDDISQEYGQESIRYYLPSCPSLNIDEINGKITLAKDNALNFEDNPIMTCDLEAHDNNSTLPSKIGYSSIVINVTDVVDEPPELQGMPSDLSIEENSPTGTELSKTITATDDDIDANIIFSIDWSNSVATNQSLTVDIALVREWFSIRSLQTKANEYTAVVIVGSSSPDHEIADLVTLAIEVRDDNTIVNADKDTGMLPISIIDKNDCSPQFVGSYDNLQVEENLPGGALITTLEIFDPDLDDTFIFDISDKSLVDVIQNGNSKTADLRIAEGADIDREVLEKIAINVTVRDARNHEAQLSDTSEDK